MKYTKESEYIQSFVDDNFNDIAIEHLTKSSQDALLPIYSLMRQANDNFKTAKLYKNYHVKSDTSYVPDFTKTIM